MAEPYAPRRRRRRPLAVPLYGAAASGAIALGALALGGLAAGPLAVAAPAAETLREAATGALDKLVVHDEARGPYEAAFEDGEGGAVALDDFRGEVVVLNLWATWCPPCREEMPALDALATETAGSDIRVVALSTDRGGAETVRAFYEEEGIERLAVYVDPRNRVPREMAVMGLPVTLILDREGRELARLTGAADWDAPEVVAMLRAVAAGGAPEDAASGAGPSFKTAPDRTSTRPGATEG